MNKYQKINQKKAENDLANSGKLRKICELVKKLNYKEIEPVELILGVHDIAGEEMLMQYSKPLTLKDLVV